MPQSIGTPALWGEFVAFVFALLAVDLAAYRRNPHEMSVREASAWTAGSRSSGCGPSTSC
ncbi:MAG: hypothetical protein ACYC37_06580 [Desulfobacteria bacterium]